MKLEFGKSGEKKAAKYLKNKGYEILEMNFRCKMGEIDIITSKDGVIVFVEVKTRKNSSYGMGYESVNESKMKKLLLTAQFYMAEKGESEARFDVISIDGGEITHIENAFGA
jgi:putative endonuclease